MRDHTPDQSRSHPAELEALALQDAELGCRIAEALARARQAEEEYASLLAEWTSLAERRLSLLGGWLSELSRRVAAGESGRQSLERRLRDHDSGLRNIGEMIRRLDDPYGLGASVDDRIADDAQGRPSDEEGE